MQIHKFILAIVLISVGLISGEFTVAEDNPSNEEVLKVRVYSDGKITLNNDESNLDKVVVALAKLKKAGGVVWYFREAGNSEPHPNAMEIMKRLAEAQLPISMSSKEDFSDVILPDGTAKSRPGN